MASVEFEGPGGKVVAAAAKPEKKDKFGFEGPVAAPPPPEAPMPQSEAGARGIFQGITLGLAPYFQAAAEASAAAETGEQFSAADLIKKAREQHAKELARARAEHPGTTLAGEFTGGALVPLPIPRGANVLTRSAIGAGTGGVLGGIGAFGHAENPSLGQFATEVGSGMAVGGALPFVTAPIAMATRAALEKLGITRMAPFRNVAHEAATSVNQAEQQAALVERQARARAAAEGRPYEPQTLTRADIGPGRPGMAIDVTGTPGQELGRSAANISPVARATLEGPLYQRRAEQLQRAEAELTPTLDRPAAGAQREALARPSPATNRAYAEAREIGDGRIQVGGTPLADLAQTRVIQGAYRRIQGDLEDAHRVDAVNRAARGLPPRNEPSISDLAVWDLIKRRLDDAYRVAQRAGNYTRANLISDANRMLRTELDRQVPEYAGARASAQAEILSRNAFEEGRRFLTAGDVYETQQALTRLATQAPQAVHEFQQGFTHAMLERMRKKATAGDLYAQIKESPDQTQRMAVALGMGRVMQQEGQRQQETIMQRALNAVVGNSTTARQWQQMALAAGGGALGGAALGLTADDLFGVGHRLHSGLGGAALPFLVQALTRRPGLNADVQVANRIAQMLVSRDPRQLQELARIAATRPPLQQALHDIANITQPAVTRGAVEATTGAVAP